MSTIITRPAFWVIMMAMWALVFPLITGAYNSIYTNTIDAGSMTSERIDRVVFGTATQTAKQAWEAATGNAKDAGSASPAATDIIKLSNASNKCSASSATSAYSGTIYTPSGNVVTFESGSNNISGCTWQKKSPVFGVFNGFVRVLLQVIALAAPIGFMLALAYFGNMIMEGMSDTHPILKVVMVVIMVLVGAILVNIALPYIADVFIAINPQRFVVFDQELGLIATLLRNFFGVIFVAGIIGSAWSIIGHMRGASTSSASFQGSGM